MQKICNKGFVVADLRKEGREKHIEIIPKTSLVNLLDFSSMAA